MSEKPLGERFLDFYNSEWKDHPEHVFMQGDFVSFFGINSRLARYHLSKMVDRQVILYVWWRSNVYYVHNSQYETILHYRRQGLKIRIR